ncbi:MAG: hypothetical protein L0219_14015, partial [Phycisphaerales bacterium]|nr:hypothetical protein [Phycisphaerales bacterium]
ERYGPELAGFVLVSPTYAGALSDIGAIADLCHSTGVPLIVDEAHGAHLVPGSTMPGSAVAGGADVVVQSLHKTLSALTQSALVHVGPQSRIASESLRAALQLMQTSSPSYLLLASIEQALRQVEGEDGRAALARIKVLGRMITSALTALPELHVYEPASAVDPAHILISASGRQPDALYNFMSERGIFAETTLGRGVLFLIGLGTTIDDARMLTWALPEFVKHIEAEPANTAFAPAVTNHRRPPEPVQILAPRQAFMMPSEVIPVIEAVGRISAATIAPCPPGTPLIVAGQRVPPEILEFASLQSLKVVIE